MAQAPQAQEQEPLVQEQEPPVQEQEPPVQEQEPPVQEQVGVGDLVANVIENINNMGAVDTNLFHNEKPRKPEKGTEVPEWKDAVVAAFKELERSGKINSVDALNKALIKYGGLISGGFILKAAKGGFVDNYSIDVPDIDIYIPIKHVPAFLNEMLYGPHKILRQAVQQYNTHEAAFYCKSFLRKNGIRKVYQFNSGRDNRAFRFDVMAVRNKRTPLNVVTNFDLTCCQVWYDGETVYATHPDHIREGKAVLQGDYVQTFYEGNKFLLERVNKYRRRGFTITYDTEAKLPTVEEVIAAHSREAQCDSAAHAVLRRRDTDFLNRWTKRIMTKWFAGITNGTDVDGNRILSVPLNRSGDQHFDATPATNHKHRSYGIAFSRFRISDEDGYDSEDFDERAMKQIGIERYTAIAPPGNELVPAPVDEELITNRLKTMLLVEVMKDGQSLDARVSYPNFGTMHRMAERGARDENPSERWFYSHKWPAVEIYYNALREKCCREGSDIFGDDGLVYDLHKHPIDGCITRDSLEGYLEGHIKNTDKEEGVPCFWQPDPVVRGAEPSPRNCQQKLTMAEIRAMVSMDFWLRFTAPAPVKSGLDQVIGAYNAVLEDVKTTNTLGFGDIHGATMCPFCLQFEGRDSGCAYMGHDNPKRRPASEHPYCLPQFVVPEMRQKYIDAGQRLDPGWVGHLEFCVECGRPCYGHKHFKLDLSDFEADRVIPDPARPGHTKIDYGTCTGGGRAELFARILAVREVYRKKGVRKPAEERKEAAEAADAVMTARRDIVARAAAIAAKPPAERKWNDKLQSKKKYNDPAYAEDEDVGDDEYNGEGPKIPPPPPGARPPPPPDPPAAAVEEEGVEVGEEEPVAAAAAVGAPAAPAPAAAAPAAVAGGLPDELRAYIRPKLHDDLDDYEDAAHRMAAGPERNAVANLVADLRRTIEALGPNRVPAPEGLNIISNMLQTEIERGLNAGADNLEQLFNWKEAVDALIQPAAQQAQAGGRTVRRTRRATRK